MRNGNSLYGAAAMSRDSLSLCVLLWSHPGEEEGLSTYEDTVLRLLARDQRRRRVARAPEGRG